VVIPVYNGAAFVGAAMASVFGQTEPPRELIVVDDASTDDSAALVEAVARTAPRPMRLIRRANNSGGPARPMNQGITAARGEFVAVLDQDDVFLPRRLETFASVLRAHPDVALAFGPPGQLGDPARLGIGGLPRRKLRQLRNAARPGHCLLFDGSQALRMMVAFGNLAVGYPGFLFRRADWERKGGLDEGLRVASDYDFACWLCARGRVAFVPRILFLRRPHGGLSVTSLDGWIELARVLRRYAPRACAGAPDPPAFRERLRTHFLWVLVGAGLAGRHAEAFSLLGSALREWGVTPEAMLTGAKLLFTRARALAVRPKCRFPAEKIEEFLRELRALMSLCRGRPEPLGGPGTEPPLGRRA